MSNVTFCIHKSDLVCMIGVCWAIRITSSGVFSGSSLSVIGVRFLRNQNTPPLTNYI